MIINNNYCLNTGSASYTGVIPVQMRGEAHTERSSNLPELTQLGRTSSVDSQRDLGRGVADGAQPGDLMTESTAALPLYLESQAREEGGEHGW